MKKVSVLLSALLLLCLVLTACDSTGSSTSTPPAGGSSSSSGTSSSQQPDTNQEPVEIIWLIRADEPPNVESVMAALNEKMLADINTTLKLTFIAPGDYNDKMPLIFSGGDEWDLCFTASWVNNYVNAANMGAYLPLDNLLAENAPGYLSIFPEKLLDGARIGGQLYGLPNYQVMYDQTGMWFLKDVAEELDLVDAIKSAASFDDVTEILRTVKQEKPEIFATREGQGGGNGGNLPFATEVVSLIFNYPFIAFEPSTKTLSKTYYMDMCEESYKVAETWYKEGLMPPDAATLKDEASMIKQGQIFSRYQRQKPGTDTEFFTANKLECITLETGLKVVNTGAVQSTITAVNANSKHPERAIQMYDYFFTNAEAFNMLIFGLEGQDYTKLDGGYIQKIPDTYAAPAWMLGNQFNAYLTEGQDADVWEQTMKGNEDALVDPLFGFVPDNKPIETELAVISGIWTEYSTILKNGLQDHTTTVDEMMVKLDAAGLDTVIDELQKQVDAFLAGK